MAREPVDDAELDEEVLPNPDDPDDVDADLLPEDDDPDAVDDTLSTADADLDEPPPLKRELTRGERRFQTLANQNRKLQEELRETRENQARLGGAIDAFTRTPRDNEAAQRAEQERVANMSDREYADYRANMVHQENQRMAAQQGFQLQDRLDRGDFRDLCRGNSAYASVQAEVEKRLVDLRRNNVNVDRQVLADKILGERAAARAASGGKATRRVVNEPPRRQSSRAASAGPDQVEDRPQRGSRKNETAKDRLSRLDVKF